MTNTSDDSRIPVVTEDASVRKISTVKGQTRLKLKTEEVEELVNVSLDREVAEVTHVPVNRLLEEGEKAPELRNENGVLIVPVIEEVAVVIKRLRIVEELHVTLRHQTDEREMQVLLRKQHVAVEQRPAEEAYPQDPDSTGEKT